MQPNNNDNNIWFVFLSLHMVATLWTMVNNNNKQFLFSVLLQYYRHGIGNTILEKRTLGCFAPVAVSYGMLAVTL